MESFLISLKEGGDVSNPTKKFYHTSQN